MHTTCVLSISLLPCHYIVRSRRSNIYTNTSLRDKNASMRGHHNTLFHTRKGRVSYRPIESQDGTKSTGKIRRVDQRRGDSQSTKKVENIYCGVALGGQQALAKSPWTGMAKYDNTFPNEALSKQVMVGTIAVESKRGDSQHSQLCPGWWEQGFPWKWSPGGYRWVNRGG